MTQKPIHDALYQRKSICAFTPQPVERETINRVLKAARYAPSGTNTQPWNVAVVTGDQRDALTQKLVEAHDNGAKRQMDYDYYPPEWRSPFTERRNATGKLMYETLGISRDDKAARRAQWAANYRGFDAPMLLFFFMDSDLEKGAFLDTGMFLQSVMLAALDEGLATCAQGALGEFPDIVKAHLGYPQESYLLCGMAVGYPDETAAVNQFRTPREPLDNFVQYFSQ